MLLFPSLNHYENRNIHGKSWKIEACFDCLKIITGSTREKSLALLWILQFYPPRCSDFRFPILSLVYLSVNFERFQILFTLKNIIRSYNKTLHKTNLSCRGSKLGGDVLICSAKFFQRVSRFSGIRRNRLEFQRRTWDLWSHAFCCLVDKQCENETMDVETDFIQQILGCISKRSILALTRSLFSLSIGKFFPKWVQNHLTMTVSDVNCWYVAKVMKLS